MIPKELREKAQKHPESITKKEWDLICEEMGMTMSKGRK